MQRTSNYQLPQWEKDDRIMMEDFNDMTAKIDAGMERAQSTADTASAHKNYAYGSYNGSIEDVTINVGFRPSAVFITRRFNSPSDVDQHLCIFFIDTETYSYFQFLDDGFKINAPIGAYPNPGISGARRFFSYLALR